MLLLILAVSGRKRLKCISHNHKPSDTIDEVRGTVKSLNTPSQKHERFYNLIFNMFECRPIHVFVVLFVHYLTSCSCLLLWYVYTIPAVSLLLASTTTTSNSPVVAFHPVLSTRLHAYIHITLVPLHTLTPFPVVNSAAPFIWMPSQHKMHADAHTPAHVSRCMPDRQCPMPSPASVSSCPLVISLCPVATSN